jgi:hypothetical protein
MINDNNLRFGTGTPHKEADLEALENGDWQFSETDVQKEHVLRYLWEDEDMTVEEIGEATGLRDWIVSACLAYHRIDTDVYDKPTPKHPPWKPSPRDSEVKSVSSSRGVGYNGR